MSPAHRRALVLAALGLPSLVPTAGCEPGGTVAPKNERLKDSPPADPAPAKGKFKTEKTFDPREKLREKAAAAPK